MILDRINTTFWGLSFAGYASAVKEKDKALGNIVGFIDGMVTGVARTGRNDMLQIITYNGPKRKNAFKIPNHHHTVTSKNAPCRTDGRTA